MKTKPLLPASALLLLLLCLIAPPLGRAQWLTEALSLTPGWNAVYLSVEPASTDCASLFASLPVQSVAMWSQREARLQFTTEPSQLLPRNPDWLYWLPPSNSQALLNSLYAIHGGQSYLIRLPTNTAPIAWRLQGSPVLFRRAWLAQNLNLTGLPVATGTASFDAFFHPSSIKTAPADGGEVYQVSSAGHGGRVFQPLRTTIQPGLAYWIRCADASSYSGPTRVELDYGSVMEFHTGVWTRHLLIKNESLATSTVQVRLWPSETPPAGTPPLAGPVPLSYGEKDWSQGTPQDVFKALAPSVSRSLAPGETWSLELTPRRQQMSGAPPGALWQSLLEVTDGGIVRQWIGVRAQ